jgi:2'-hydroxyisoflavone reductase
MKLLVIGGTRFVGRAAVEAAVGRGHEVTVFHRGDSEPADLPEVEHVHGDRDGGSGVLRGRGWDGALDTCGYVPRQVRELAEALSDSVGHYAFVSSLSVYPDDTPAGANEDSPTHGPPFPNTEEVDDQTYGPLKVACEREAELGFPGRSLIVRPGYIVGPHDTSDRFTYWIRRAAQGGEMLAPAPEDEAIQVVDVRDLAAFMLDHLEARTNGVFGVVGPGAPLTWAGALSAAVAAGEAGTALTWVDPAFLRAQLGERVESALPLWDVEYSGLHRFDAGRAMSAGLRHRPFGDTVADTLAWDRARDGEGLAAGLSRDHERRLLAAWHAASDPA